MAILRVGRHGAARAAGHERRIVRTPGGAMQSPEKTSNYRELLGSFQELGDFAVAAALTRPYLRRAAAASF